MTNHPRDKALYVWRWDNQGGITIGNATGTSIWTIMIMALYDDGGITVAEMAWRIFDELRTSGNHIVTERNYSYHHVVCGQLQATGVIRKHTKNSLI